MFHSTVQLIKNCWHSVTFLVIQPFFYALSYGVFASRSRVSEHLHNGWIVMKFGHTLKCRSGTRAIHFARIGKPLYIVGGNSIDCSPDSIKNRVLWPHWPVCRWLPRMALYSGKEVNLKTPYFWITDRKHKKCIQLSQKGGDLLSNLFVYSAFGHNSIHPFSSLHKLLYASLEGISYPSR